MATCSLIATECDRVRLGSAYTARPQDRIPPTPSSRIRGYVPWKVSPLSIASTPPGFSFRDCFNNVAIRAYPPMTGYDALRASTPIRMRLEIGVCVVDLHDRQIVMHGTLGQGACRKALWHNHFRNSVCLTQGKPQNASAHRALDRVWGESCLGSGRSSIHASCLNQA